FRLRLRPDKELRQKPERPAHPAEAEADDRAALLRDPQFARALCLAELRKRNRWRCRRRPPAVTQAQFVPRLAADALAFLQIVRRRGTIGNVHARLPLETLVGEPSPSLQPNRGSCLRVNSSTYRGPTPAGAT